MRFLAEPMAVLKTSSGETRNPDFTSFCQRETQVVGVNARKQLGRIREGSRELGVSEEFSDPIGLVRNDAGLPGDALVCEQPATIMHI